MAEPQVTFPRKVDPRAWVWLVPAMVFAVLALMLGVTPRVRSEPTEPATFAQAVIACVVGLGPLLALSLWLGRRPRSTLEGDVLVERRLRGERRLALADTTLLAAVRGLHGVTLGAHGPDGMRLKVPLILKFPHGHCEAMDRDDTRELAEAVRRADVDHTIPERLWVEPEGGRAAPKPTMGTPNFLGIYRQRIDLLALWWILQDQVAHLDRVGTLPENGPLFTGTPRSGGKDAE